MLNIRDLEKRWLRYKIKTYTPYIVIGLSLIVITSVTYIFTNNISKDVVKVKELKQTPIKTKEQPTKTLISEANVTKENNKTDNIKKKEISTENKIRKEIQEKPLLNEAKQEQLLLKPSMSFLTNIQNQPEDISYKAAPKQTKRVVQQQTPVKEKYFPAQEPVQVNKKSSSENIIEEKPIEKSVITIERRDSQKDIDDIIKRFKKNNNPALSLFVAKKYYELGNYEQSYNYALITNGIDNNIEDSWLIFAKSLVKLKKREMAIKTLQEYINYSHSGNAKILLDDIKTGKFQ